MKDCWLKFRKECRTISDSVVNKVVTFFILVNFPSLDTHPWDLWFYFESSRAMLHIWNVDLRPSIHSWWSHSYYLDFFELFSSIWNDFFFNTLLFPSLTHQLHWNYSCPICPEYLPKSRSVPWDHQQAMSILNSCLIYASEALCMKAITFISYREEE